MTLALLACLALAAPKTLTGHAGALVGGTAYLTGGMGLVNEGHFFGELWKVDLARGAWTVLPGPKTPRGMAAMARLGDTLVLAGGLAWGDKTLATVERYDIKRGTWSNMPDLREARSRFAMVETGGKLYAVGGLGSRGNLASIECYDPAKKAWSAAGRLSKSRHGLAAVAVDGKIVVAGGYAEDMVADVEVYDPRTGRCSPAPSMPTPRGFFALAPVTGGCVAVGGRQRGAAATRLDLKSRIWRPATGLEVERNRFVALADGKHLWIVGGEAVPTPPLIRRYDLP